MVEITDTMLKEVISRRAFSIKKLTSNTYKMTLDFYSVELVALCTIELNDIHVEFETGEAKPVGMCRHSILASALTSNLSTLEKINLNFNQGALTKIDIISVLRQTAETM